MQIMKYWCWEGDRRVPAGINWDETAVSGLIETGGAFVNCILLDCCQGNMENCT